MNATQGYLALLRVSGADWNVEAALAQHHLKAAWWRKGTQLRPIDQAGFNLVVAQADVASDLGTAAAEWLQNNATVVAQLVPTGGQGTLVLLFPDGDSPDPRRGCALGASALGVLAASGLGLEFKAYSRSREQV